MADSGPRRWPRLGLLPVIIITSPLFALPVLALLPIRDSYRLQEAGGWPPQRALDHLDRRLQAVAHAFTPAPVARRGTELPLLELGLARKELDALGANLPASGFVTRRGTLRYGAGPIRAKLRYRGDNAFHWFFPKRSWRLKTRKREPLPWGRDLHLINPKDGHFLSRYLSSYLAGKLGLLTSPPTLVLVNLNGRFQGVYVAQPDVDESLLRAQRRMPGDVFYGDLSRKVDPLGRRYFLTDPHGWRRVASSGQPPTPNEEPPLVRLVRQLGSGYWSHSERALDEEYMARFCALISLLNTNHYDSLHNLLLYLDPLTGQFQMIEWDSEGGAFGDRAPEHNGLDITSNLIFQALLENPVFNARKNALLHRLLRDGALLRAVEREAQAAGERIAPHVARDRLDRRGFNFPAPAAFADRLQESRAVFRKRGQYLLALLDAAKLRFAHREGTLTLEANGYAPCEQVELTFARPLPARITIHQDRNRDGKLDPGDPEVRWERVDAHTLRLSDTVYPGRSRAGSMRENRLYLEPAPLAYAYHLVGVGAPRAVRARNAFTKARVEGVAAEALRTRSCDSLHPWSLPPEPAPVHWIVGESLHLKKDWVIQEHETVTIPAGTTISLGPGVSILCRGKLRVEGAPQAPVVFEPAGKPWGTLALIGRGADGSRFRHTLFRGARGARRNHARFPGMVSVHRARDVVFRDCRFGRAPAEDMLRAADAELSVVRSQFVNGRSDGIDFDHSSGAIRSCQLTKLGNDGIDLMGSDPTIAQCTISASGDKGISIGERSAPRVVGARIHGAPIGIEIKDGSDPLIVDCTVDARQQAIHGYTKNWRYGAGGRGWILGGSLTGPRAVDLAPGSRLTLSGVRLTGTVRGAAGRTGPQPLAEKLAGARLVVRHDFQEDLTDRLHGWTLHPNATRWSKSRRGLELPASPGQPRVLRWESPLLNQTGWLVIEALAERPLELAVVADDSPPTPLTLQPHFTRHVVAIAPGKGSLELRVPAGQVTIRRVEVWRPTLR